MSSHGTYHIGGSASNGPPTLECGASVVGTVSGITQTGIFLSVGAAKDAFLSWRNATIGSDEVWLGATLEGLCVEEWDNKRERYILRGPFPDFGTLDDPWGALTSSSNDGVQSRWNTSGDTWDATASAWNLTGGWVSAFGERWDGSAHAWSAQKAWASSPPVGSDNERAENSWSDWQNVGSEGAADVDTTSRQAVARAAFQRLDVDGDGFLDRTELRPLADQTGFDGSAAEWTQEFQQLCADWGCDPLRGINRKAFEKLVEDDSEKGCFCTVEELGSLQPIDPSQSELVRGSCRNPIPEGIELGGGKQKSKGGDGKGKLDFMCPDGKGGKARADHHEVVITNLPYNIEASAVEKEFSDCGDILECRLVTDKETGKSRGMAILTFANDKAIETALEYDGEIFEGRALRVRASGSKGSGKVGTNVSSKTSSDAFKVVVSNLDFKIDEEILRKDFGECGEVRECKLLLDKDTGRSRGIAFITFASEAAVQSALEYDGDDYSGRQLRVSRAADKVMKGRGKDVASEQHLKQNADVGEPLAKAQGNASLSAPQQTSPQTRAELKKAVFRSLDMDGDGRLSRAEMRRFAEQTGFDGDDASWEEEFGLLCREVRVEQTLGLDEVSFGTVLDDDSDGGCYCTDQELAAMLSALKPTEQQVLVIQPAEVLSKPTIDSSCADQPRRSDLKTAAFELFDRDRDGFLRCEELRSFATYTGFDGSAEEWIEEYNLLCHDLGAKPCTGVPIALFAQLVDDESDSGCYATDEELINILKSEGVDFCKSVRVSSMPTESLATPPVAPAGVEQPIDDLTRIDLKKRLFRVLDVANVGRLGLAELKPFVVHTGFDGNAEDWQEEYSILCQDLGIDGAAGVSLDRFMAFIDDESDKGCYCTDEELRRMLGKFSGANHVPAGTTKSVTTSASSDFTAATQGTVKKYDADAADFDPWSTPVALKNLQTQRAESAAKPTASKEVWNQWTDQGKPGAFDPRKPVLNAQKLLDASRAALALRKSELAESDASNAQVNSGGLSLPVPDRLPEAENDDAGGGFYEDAEAFATEAFEGGSSSSTSPPRRRVATMVEAVASMASCIARLLAGDRLASSDFVNAVLSAPSQAHAMAITSSALRSVLQGRIDEAKALLSLDELIIDPAGEASLMDAFGQLAREVGASGAPFGLRALLAILTKADDRSIEIRSAAAFAAESLVVASDRFGFEALLPALTAALDSKRSPALKLLALRLLSACWRGDGEPAVSQRLPALLPVVSSLLLDSSVDVRSAAGDSVDVLLPLCRNKDLRPHFDEIRACASGSRDISKAVRDLAEVVFVQKVEASSMAVVMPVLTKGLKSRNAKTKRQACVIAENMCRLLPSVADVQVFAPQLLPLLARISEEAPDIDVRAVAGRAQKSLEQVAKVDASDVARLEVKSAVMAAIVAAGAVSSRQGGGDLLESCPPHVRDVVVDYVALLCVGLGSCGVREESRWRCHLLPHLQPLVGQSQAEVLCNELQAIGGRLYIAKEPETEGGVESDNADADAVGVQLCDCVFTLACGAATLLSGARLKLVQGRIYGLVGGNDSGKSALLRAIHERKLEGFPGPQQLVTSLVEHGVGEREPESGWSPIQYLLADSKLKARGLSPLQAADALRKLGFSEQIHRPIHELSGGWRMKLALTKAMLQEPHVLLLDEPTGHLDAMHIGWLVDYLAALTKDQQRGVTTIVVSHDASFLDQVCSHIIHVSERKLVTCRGNFSSFLKRVPDAQLGSVRLIAAPLNSCEESPTQDLRAFVLPEPGALEGVRSRSMRFLYLQNVTFTYPGSVSGPAVRNATVECTLRSRVACTGPNGAGKSTLAGLIVGELAPDTGTAWRHPNLRVAFVAQHTFHHLERHLELTATQYILWRFAGNDDREAIEFRADDEECSEPRSYRFDDGRLVVCDAEDAGVVELEAVLDRRQRGRLGYEYEVRWRQLDGAVSSTTTWLTRPQLASMGCLAAAKREDERQAVQRALVTRPLTTPSVEAHLAGFGLGAEEASHRRLGALSDGQRARAVLGAATWLAPHLLVLDEPSNYLDRPSLAALAAGLQAFGGGVILISHNAALLNAICSERWLVVGGCVQCEADALLDHEFSSDATISVGVSAKSAAARAAAAAAARERKKQKRLKELRLRNGEQVPDEDDQWWEDLVKKAVVVRKEIDL